MTTATTAPCPLDAFLERAQKDLPVYITQVRESFLAGAGTELFLVLTQFNGRPRRLALKAPAEYLDSAEYRRFVREYLFAEVYNILSSLGGRRLDIYTDARGPLRDILEELPAAFGIGVPRGDRIGYGRSVNVIERMLDSQGVRETFCIALHPLDRLPPPPPSTAVDTDIATRFAQAFADAGNKILCGVDIGGTDIKLCVSYRGRLCFLKEYDWFPALFTRAAQLIEPVRLLLRLLRARVSCEGAGVESQIVQALEHAIDSHVADGEIKRAVDAAEQALGGRLTGFDAIGLCFPDVVIRNKIVGGEVFKTRGIRDNPDIEYESEFRRLMDLDTLLAEYCAPGGAVRMTNDGPMAAFTAAIELIAQGRGEQLRDGRFAHTLGTELGTGWIDESGEIPEIPLEVYNFIIDLGSYGARQYHPDDLRSINNFNTGLPGTLQKFMAQNGVFRLAIKASRSGDGKLYQELLDGGFLLERDGGVFVALEPKDMRKPLLEFLMQRCEAGDRELEEVFVEIGRSTGITYRETEHILAPKTPERVLYGRLVKLPHCFALLRRGAEETAPGMQMSVADEQSAYSDFMRQLMAHPVYTVAQFAQSVGALYYGNLSQ